MFDVQIGHWESNVRPFCIDAEFNGLDVNLYQISYICIVDLSGQRKQFGFLSVMLVFFIFHKEYKLVINYLYVSIFL